MDNKKWIREYMKDSLESHYKRKLSTSITFSHDVVLDYKAILSALSQKFEDRYALTTTSFPDIPKIYTQRIFNNNADSLDVRPLLEIKDSEGEINQSYLERELAHVIKNNKATSIKQTKLKPLLTDFTESLLETRCSMYPVMHKFHVNLRFNTSSLIFNIHPLVTTLDSNHNVIKKILLWKIQCQDIDREAYFLLIVKLFFEQILLDLFRCDIIRNQVDKTINMLKNNSITNTFQLQSAGLLSTEFIADQIISSSNMLSVLESYLLPTLIYERDKLVKDISNKVEFGNIRQLMNIIRGFKSRQEMLHYLSKKIKTENDLDLVRKALLLCHVEKESEKSVCDDGQFEPMHLSYVTPTIKDMFPVLNVHQDYGHQWLSEKIQEHLKERHLKNRVELSQSRRRVIRKTKLKERIKHAHRHYHNLLNVVPDNLRNKLLSHISNYITKSDADIESDLVQSLQSQEFVFVSQSDSNFHRALYFMRHDDSLIHQRVARYRRECLINNQDIDHCTAMIRYCDLVTRYRGSSQVIRCVQKICYQIRDEAVRDNRKIVDIKWMVKRSQDMYEYEMDKLSFRGVDVKHLLFPFVNTIARMTRLKKLFLDIMCGTRKQLEMLQEQ
ncbi:hypothetical protein AKO1_009001 [Acrasis kona]|uniref:Uncharacterized protein n=1 Tax=Acrasis kona TaxID=1008807 RepID=A0AAW2ZJW3_9EUKA